MVGTQFDADHVQCTLQIQIVCVCEYEYEYECLYVMMLNRNHAVIFQKLPLSLFSQANNIWRFICTYAHTHVQKSTQSLKNRTHTNTNSVPMLYGYWIWIRAENAHTRMLWILYVQLKSIPYLHTQTHTNEPPKCGIWTIQNRRVQFFLQFLNRVFFFICLFKFYSCNILRKIDHLHT